MTDEQLIAGLRLNSENSMRGRAMRWICADEKFNEGARKVLNSLGAKASEIDDILQDARIILIRQIEKNNFKNESTLSTYFVGICKNVYLKKIQKKRSLPQLLTSTLPYVEKNIEEAIIEKEREEECEKLIVHLLSYLGESCRKVVFMKFNNFSLEQIAEMMGYERVSQASKKIYKCRMQFRQLMKNSEEIRRIINNRLYGRF